MIWAAFFLALAALLFAAVWPLIAIGRWKAVQVAWTLMWLSLFGAALCVVQVIQ